MKAAETILIDAQRDSRKRVERVVPKIRRRKLPMPFFVLIAGVDFSAVSKRSRSMSSLSKNLELIVWVAIGIAGLWAARHYWGRYRDRILRSGDPPRSLFLELCSVHRLTRAEKTLLMQAADAAHLAEPAIAFVSPQVLDAMPRAASADSQDPRALAEKLFGRDDKSPR